MKSKKTKLVFIAFALTLCIASCSTIFAKSTPPFQTWVGKPLAQPETGLFSYPGTGAYGLVLYAIDGQPRTRMGDKRLLEGAYSNILMCGFDVLLLPGSHSFEFYSVDTDPPLVFAIRFPVKAGKTYLLEGKSSSFTLKSDGAPIPYTRKDVPTLVEPAKTQPHATLEFARKGGAMGENAWIFRIDDMIRAPMSKRHPSWVVMNYSGLASGIVNSVGGGMLIQANMEAAEGTLLVRLTPGRHSIEGFAETMFIGSRILGDAVRIVEFDFKAGKAYKIILVKDTAMNEKSGLNENGFAVVSK